MYAMYNDQVPSNGLDSKPHLDIGHTKGMVLMIASMKQVQVSNMLVTSFRFFLAVIVRKTITKRALC